MVTSLDMKVDGFMPEESQQAALILGPDPRHKSMIISHVECI